MRGSTFALLASGLTIAACAEPHRATGHHALAGGWDGNRGGWDGNRGGWDGNRGGWDGNRGGWDGNLGSWGGDAAGWAPEGTGPGTLSNPTLIGVTFLASAGGATPCGTLTPGVAAIRARSSRSLAAGGWIGPDVEVTAEGGATRWLGEGETVTVRGRAYNGYLHYVAATFRVTRLTTYRHPRQPGVAWPAFHLEACKDADPDEGFVGLGVVTFMPFFRLPERPDEPLVWHEGIVQPVSVPYSTQPAALPFKFAAGAGLPVALAGEAALDPVGCASGGAVPNREMILAGGLALGNASWVTLPGDDHRFLAFFTRDGNPVALFAQIVGGSAEQVCLPGAQPGQRVAVDMLQLTAVERAPYNSDKLDAVATGDALALLSGLDRAMAPPTQLASGRSTFRSESYRQTSLHPSAEELLAQRAANLAATRLGPRIGAIASQDELLWLAVGRVSFFVAAQSPVPELEDFLRPPPPGVCGNDACEADETCISCPGDCPICDVPPPWEGGGGGGSLPPDAGAPSPQDAGAPPPMDQPIPIGGDAGTGP
jgi:hypothetical protein